MEGRKLVVLVTGASSGIGKKTALDLLQQGAKVIVCARRMDEMTSLKEAGAIVYKVDLKKEPEIVAMINDLAENDIKVDVLVNNAGYAEYGSIENVPLGSARAQFEVNLFGLASLTQKLIPIMRQAGFGKIINITSIGGRIHTPLGGWYHASKFALEGWSDCLRIELREFGIDVVKIQPGAINTGWDQIALQSAIDNGSPAYAKWTGLLKKMIRDNYGESKGSPANKVSRIVQKAIMAQKPKTRYFTGRWSGFSLFMKWLLPARAFDWLMIKIISH